MTMMSACRTSRHSLPAPFHSQTAAPLWVGSIQTQRCQVHQLRAVSSNQDRSKGTGGGGGSDGGGSSGGRAGRGSAGNSGAPFQRGGEGSPGGLDPSLELAVPVDQRPISQLAELKADSLYSWAVLDTNVYIQRLFLVYAGFFAVIGGPIAYQTFDPFTQPIEWFLSGSVGSLLVVAVLSLRTYLGWQYLGDRLMRAAIDYEETGWYDGQIFVKPPEVLMRDRLVGTYEVKPTVRKLQSTLLGTGGGLLLCSIVLSGLIAAGTDADGMYGRNVSHPVPRIRTADGVIFSKNVTSLDELRYDDKLAAEEAAAAGGRPGYCSDRTLRAMAGGQYCAQYDN